MYTTACVCVAQCWAVKGVCQCVRVCVCVRGSHLYRTAPHPILMDDVDLVLHLHLLLAIV